MKGNPKERATAFGISKSTAHQDARHVACVFRWGGALA